MDFDRDDEDEEAFEGPDAYTEEDGGLQEQVEEPETDMRSIIHLLMNTQAFSNGPPSPESNSRIGRLLLSSSSIMNILRRSGRHGAAVVHSVGDIYEDSPRIPGSQTTQMDLPTGGSQEAGLALLMSGEFGRIGPKVRSRQKDCNISRVLNHPPDRLQAAAYREDISSNLVPNTNGYAVASYYANVYSGQFASDSSLYYTCAQDFRLRVYDTKAPPDPSSNEENHGSHRSTMKVLKTIRGSEGQWTITDSHISPDTQRIIYSSIMPTVYMANTLDSSTTQIPIPFADPVSRDRRTWYYDNSFGIWSCRFSADGNEVIAGGSGNLYVYDLLAQRRTIKISAHEDDVNSCCWADTTSGNVLISGSDDSYIKVWDRRSLGEGPKPSGVLVGHTEGITYVSAKGDGRYVISNGKDQALRLWDLRKMRSSADFDDVEDCRTGFDYRGGRPPKLRRSAHPQDCSVMTYRGHAVLRTLIRCHFSPAETTGAQYIYSGSADGRIHIWSLDGRVVQILDRAESLPLYYDPAQMPAPRRRRAKVCVRDVSWHSQEPVILSTGWEIDSEGSVIARHEWKGLSKMNGRLEDWNEKQGEQTRSTPRRRR